MDDYVTNLDPSLESHFHQTDNLRPDHIGAVMYGKTQAGKTTLILKLMGLSESTVANSATGEPSVTQIMRAGRTKGKSATALPTRYSWSSHSDRWEYSLNGEGAEELSGREVFARLQEFRDEKGDPSFLGHEGVLDLRIPNRYRSESAAAVVPMILDLPGVGAHSPQEQEYAARLVRRYVPAAQMVVLMSTADSVASLFSGLVRELPQLSVWDTVPERFRIVLTRTVSSSSVRGKFAHAETTASTEWLREHAYTELALSHRAARLVEDPAIKDRIKSVLFPIEFGESWADLQREHPDLHDNFKPVIDELLSDLAGDVGRQAVEDSRRISMSHAATTVRIAAERHNKELEEELENAVENEQSHRKSLQGAKDRCRSAEEKVEIARELRDSLKWSRRFDMSLDRGGCRTDTANGHAVREVGDRNRQELVERTQNKWNEWLHSKQVTYVRRQIGYRPPDSAVDAGAIFLLEWGCCRDCSKKWYRFFTSRPEFCQGKQEEAWDSAVTEIRSELERERDEWVTKASSAVKGRGLTLVSTTRAKERADKMVEKYERDTEEAEQVAAAARGDLDDYQQVVEAATRESLQLANMLDAGCASEIKVHLSLADKVHGADERLAHVLGALLARHQRQLLRLEAR
jgi:hypothetical protein